MVNLRQVIQYLVIDSPSKIKSIIKYINKPFNNIKNNKHRACYILFLAGYTYKDIEALGITSHRTIYRAIKNGNKQYNQYQVSQKTLK